MKKEQLLESKFKSLAGQSLQEEIANSITHGLGIIFSIIALIALIYESKTKANTAIHIFSCTFYGISMVLLYLFSTLYHAISHISVKKVLRRLDHIGIYLLIFGTYLPISLIILHGPLGWTLFGIEAGLCFIGVLFKAIFGPKLEVLSGIFYLLMGWVSVIAFKSIYEAISFEGFFWILLGGLFYTLGIIFFAIDKKVPFFHAIWHVFVLLGSICHFFMVINYAIPFSW
ncbi:MAG: hemolysin III family protein [Parachlamydiales bacterium]|jgi:hemolysin III